MTRLLAYLVVCVGACLASLFAAGTPASAHPLGNFTTNQYAGLRIGPDAVTVDYVLDLAELAAVQARNNADTDHDGTVSTDEQHRYATDTCTSVADTQEVRRDGQQIILAVTNADVGFPPGTGGLPTLRLECRLSAPMSIGPDSVVEYAGSSFADQQGWNEVTAVGDRVTLVSSDVPTASISRRLTAYPDGYARTPLNVRTARLVVRTGGPPASPDPEEQRPTAATRGVDSLTLAFTELVGTPRLTWWLGLAAVALSIVLGAAHALAPGHGKTVMAAFLVGERGSLRHAVVLGLSVTLTHTAGVMVLGAVLATSLVLAPEQLYGWLGLASGLLLALVGAILLRRAWRRADHSHPHTHRHHGHTHSDDHGHAHHHEHGKVAVAGGPLRLQALVAMGFAGGLVPSPSALVVLLGAVALGRTWFGILLVIGYGVGMAATLTLLGLALARWRTAVEHRVSGRAATLLRRFAPLATSGLIILVGVGLAARAAAIVAAFG